MQRGDIPDEDEIPQHTWRKWVAKEVELEVFCHIEMSNSSANCASLYFMLFLNII